MTIDQTDRRVVQLHRAAAQAAEELANTAKQLRFERDKGRLCARLLLQAMRDAKIEAPSWIAKQVDDMPDPTADPKPAAGPPTTIAALCGQVNDLRAERAKLVDMLLDAVNQGAPRYRKESDRIFDGALSTWEEILPWLVDHGLARGNPKDGYELIWPKAAGQ